MKTEIHPYNGKCVHGIPTFGEDGKIIRCPQCHSDAINAIGATRIEQLKKEGYHIERL